GGDAVDLLRNVAKRLCDRRFFVEGGDLNDKLHAVRASVIMPVERIGGDAERAIESVLRQEAPFPFELILVSAAPLAIDFGSGVACHENRPGIFAITNASDVALVNLFVRKSSFRGFDEAIGYIGEDTSLIGSLLSHVVYHSGVRVFHRRRAFPRPYLRQRWR